MLSSVSPHASTWLKIKYVLNVVLALLFTKRLCENKSQNKCNNSLIVSTYRIRLRAALLNRPSLVRQLEIDLASSLNSTYSSAAAWNRSNLVQQFEIDLAQSGSLKSI